MDYRAVYGKVIADPRYAANIDWGEPRPWHQEGSVRAHISDLERNLAVLRPRLTVEEYWMLRVLIHTHDTMKAVAQLRVPILDPHSHASLARAFLAEYCDDLDLLTMVQFHDEHYALYQELQTTGNLDGERLQKLLSTIQNWDVFLAFIIIDGCSPGKSRAPLHWLFQTIHEKITSRFTEQDIIA